MKRFVSLVIILLIPTVILANEISHINLIDNLLIKRINEYREAGNLPVLKSSKVLQKASQHHAFYMAKTKIVSHFQQMELASMRSIYSPRKRIAYFANNVITKDNHYAEIVIGINVKNKDPYKIADRIWKQMISSDNRVLLDDGNVHYYGLTTIKKGNDYFLTIKFGLGYDNIVALLEE